MKVESSNKGSDGSAVLFAEMRTDGLQLATRPNVLLWMGDRLRYRGLEGLSRLEHGEVARGSPFYLATLQTDNRFLIAAELVLTVG